MFASDYSKIGFTFLQRYLTIEYKKSTIKRGRFGIYSLELFRIILDKPLINSTTLICDTTRHECPQTFFWGGGAKIIQKLMTNFIKKTLNFNKL